MLHCLANDKYFFFPLMFLLFLTASVIRCVLISYTFEAMIVKCVFNVSFTHSLFKTVLRDCSRSELLISCSLLMNVS